MPGFHHYSNKLLFPVLYERERDKRYIILSNEAIFSDYLFTMMTATSNGAFSVSPFHKRKIWSLPSGNMSQSLIGVLFIKEIILRSTYRQCESFIKKNFFLIIWFQKYLLNFELTQKRGTYIFYIHSFGVLAKNYGVELYPSLCINQKIRKKYELLKMISL